MYSLARRALFSLSPPAAHALGMLALGPLERLSPLRALTRALLSPSDPRLAVHAMGLRFPSPIGIAGGFDKNGTRARALSSLGFGFVEVGTVTAVAQEENPKPNLFRLPADRALVNRLGFPNQGAREVVARLEARGGASAVGVPLAVSIGKSRAVPLEPVEAVIDDYLASFAPAARVADFVVVNVSSPNTKGLRAMQGAELARALFTALAKAAAESPRRPPLLVKIAPDLGDDELEALLAVVEETKLAGVVATNTTLARRGLATDAARVEAIGTGGLSGPPLRARALEVVGRVRARLGSGPVVIGVGGVERPEHALALLEAGANLVQLYTGFIYEGPWVARALSRGLSRRLDQTGGSSVATLTGGGRSIDVRSRLSI